MRVLLPGLAACTTMSSIQRQIEVEVHDVSVIGLDVAGAPMLHQTTTCPVFRCLGSTCPPEGGPNFLDCFSLGSGGQVSYEANTGCYTFGDAGVARWRFDRQVCDAEAMGYGPVDDAITFTVVDADQVRFELVRFEELVEANLSPGEDAVFPPDWRQPRGVPWRLAGPYRLLPGLYVDDLFGVEVGYTFARSRFDVDGAAGVTVDRSARWLEVTADPGASADLKFVVGDDAWTPSVPVVGVDPSEAASLEVVVAYEAFWTFDATPAGARAVVRDVQGRLLWGAPVVWSLDEGLLAVGEDLLPGDDYVTLRDGCVEPAENLGDHRAVVRATLGSLTATAELAWTVTAVASGPFEPSPACVEGGGPTEPDTGSSGGTLLPDPTVDDLVSAPAPPSQLAGGSCGCGGGGKTRPWLALAALALAWTQRSRTRLAPERAWPTATTISP